MHPLPQGERVRTAVAVRLRASETGHTCRQATVLYKPSMIRSFLTVSVGTLASRLLGFVRDAMIAALLGTGPVADAFLIAFQLVNVVRRLLTEGALNAALVPGDRKSVV